MLMGKTGPGYCSSINCLGEQRKLMRACAARSFAGGQISMDVHEVLDSQKDSQPKK